MTTTLTTTTVEERFNAALAEVRTKHVHVALNVMTCCRSCTDYPDLGLTSDAEGSPIVWHYGGQGSELVWEDGRPRYRDEVDDECRCTEDEYDEDDDGNEYLLYEGDECDVCRYGAPEPRTRPAERLYFQHEGGAANVVRDALLARGFTVEWDGTDSQTVQVVF